MTKTNILLQDSDKHSALSNLCICIWILYLDLNIFHTVPLRNPCVCICVFVFLYLYGHLPVPDPRNTAVKPSSLSDLVFNDLRPSHSHLTTATQRASHSNIFLDRVFVSNLVSIELAPPNTTEKMLIVGDRLCTSQDPAQ